MLAMVGIYLILAFSFALKEGENIRQVLLLPYLYFVLHISYGWGYLRGIIRFLILKKSGTNVEPNR
jgi:hypothetical protein